MNQMTQLLIVCAAATHMFHYMMVVAIESRKRKCYGHAPIGRISYAPIEGTDRSRIDYLNNKIWKNNVICVNMLRVASVVYWKALFICVLSSKLLYFCIP
jgi:hypothetical protein